jgi:hypothetical protein
MAKPETITEQQAFDLAMAIGQNENRPANELTDSEIEGYLIDRGWEDSEANVEKIREA